MIKVIESNDSKLTKQDLQKFIKGTLHTKYVDDVESFLTTLRDNGFEILSAYYKDANHNRQSWIYTFYNEETKQYVQYSRIASGSVPSAASAPERIYGPSTTAPVDRLQALKKISSYDDIHDYTSGDHKYMDILDKVFN